MKEQIERMARLQRVETEIDAVRNRLAGVDRRIAGLESAGDTSGVALAGHSGNLDDLRKRYRDMDGDVSANADAIARKKARVNTLKTNKEYQAMLREIDDLGKRNTGLENAMFDILEEIEAAETGLVEVRAEAERVGAEIAAAVSGVREDALRDEARLAELIEKRTAIAAELPPDMLARFEKVRSRVPAPAMVPVVGASCEGCNMNIPPQMRNELQRFDSLKNCPFCHRIIYWKEA